MDKKTSHHDNRTRNLSVSFSDDEYELFEKAVRNSGLKKTDYARRMLTEGHVVQRISADDRKQINHLSKIGRDIHRLLGAAYKEGLVKHVKWLGEIELSYKEQFKNINEIMK